MSMLTRKICPIKNDVCLGKECAMAVKMDHPLISAYDIVWKCGLVNDPDILEHGKAYVIDIENRS